MDVRVKWAGDLTFVGHGHQNEHAVVMDGGKSDGGLGIGASPMEMLLMGAGGCASIDIIMILKKAHQKVDDCYVEVNGDRAQEIPKVFNSIHMNFVLTGRGVKRSQVERAVTLSMEKYCSASLTLSKGLEITHTFEVRETE